MTSGPAQNGGATNNAVVVIADYDFGDVDLERSIIDTAGFELVAAQCKTEDDVIEVARDAQAVIAQYATITPWLCSSPKPGSCAATTRKPGRGCGAGSPASPSTVCGGG